MQEKVKTGTKYLMPSCSLQQAAAIAEHIVQDILEVDLNQVDVHGNNIFRTPMMGRDDVPGGGTSSGSAGAGAERVQQFCRLSGSERASLAPEPETEGSVEGGVENWAGSGRYRKGPQNPHIFPNSFSPCPVSCCLFGM